MLSLAVAAQVTHDTRFYLAAILITLPFGIAAVVGVYIVYGLLSQVVAALSSEASGGQLDHRTLLVTAPVNVLLFAAAAIANVALARALRSSRRPRVGG